MQRSVVYRIPPLIKWWYITMGFQPCNLYRVCFREPVAMLSVCVFPGAGVFQHRERSPGVCCTGAVGKILRKEGDLCTAQESSSTVTRHGCTVRHESYCGEVHNTSASFVRKFIPAHLSYCILWHFEHTLIQVTHVHGEILSIPAYSDRLIWPVLF